MGPSLRVSQRNEKMLTTIDAWYLGFFAFGMIAAWAVIRGLDHD